MLEAGALANSQSPADAMQGGDVSSMRVRDLNALINIAHTDRNVFVTNIIDVGTFRTVENCSALSQSNPWPPQ